MDKLNQFQVVDLFCGVGGLSYGMKQSGLSIAAGIDIDTTCEFAYATNVEAKFISKSVTDISGVELSSLYDVNKRKILVGCAPCQPFSSHSHKRKNKINIAEEDNRWSLLFEFKRLIEEVQPDIISMENVPQLIKHSIFDEFIAALISHGYYVSDYSKIVFCPNYGIPQKRQRLVLLASKLGEIELIPPTHTKYITVADSIRTLPPIADGETHETDNLHRSRKLSPINLRRIKSIKEGQTWTSFKDLDLIAPCHLSDAGKKFTSVYGRMRWDDVAPTITTHCIGLSNGCFGHPDQNRAISLREAALLQSFPKTYRFAEDGQVFNMAAIARHIGNAVPPLLGVAIAKSIEKHINQFVN